MQCQKHFYFEKIKQRQNLRCGYIVQMSVRRRIGAVKCFVPPEQRATGKAICYKVTVITDCIDFYSAGKSQGNCISLSVFCTEQSFSQFKAVAANVSGDISPGEQVIGSVVDHTNNKECKCSTANNCRLFVSFSTRYDRRQMHDVDHKFDNNLFIVTSARLQMLFYLKVLQITFLKWILFQRNNSIQVRF